ncbi:hypothetical protein ACW7G2_09910 [Luteimonas sp. A277]
MNAIPSAPFPPSWTAHQFAEAVVPRISDLDLSLSDFDAGHAANLLVPRPLQHHYLTPTVTAQRFRIGN